MALIAGAGNPTGGSNPSGTGGGINYIGEHAYGMSGEFDFTNDTAYGLAFNTSNEYVVANVTFGCSVASALNVMFEIKINDEVIYRQIADEGQQSGGPAGLNEIQILFPSFSKIQLGIANATSTATEQGSIVMVGRVYA